MNNKNNLYEEDNNISENTHLKMRDEIVSKFRDEVLSITKGKVDICDTLNSTKIRYMSDIIKDLSKIYLEMDKEDQEKLQKIISGEKRNYAHMLLSQTYID